jgi:hypothetical protein
MSTSGTYNFNPSTGSLGAYALRRCGVSRAAINTEHLADIAMASNMVLSQWATSQPNLFLVRSTTLTVTTGNPGPYSLPSDVILVLDAYITVDSNDRVLSSVGRSEYIAFPNKTTQSPPTIFWFDRVVPPTLTFYPAPDQTYTVTYYAVHQDQDAVVPGALTLDLPNRYLNAFKDALSAELAVIYAPTAAPALYALAQQTKRDMDAQDREVVPLYIVPDMSSYYDT